MPFLYERLMGYSPAEYQAAGLAVDARGKLSVHAFESAAAEWVRGNMTGAQATSAFALNTTEQTEAQDVVATVTGLAAAGDRALQILAIAQVLMLAEGRIAPYTTAAAVRTRLGVPTR